MQIVNRELKPWYHGAAAFILGVIVLLLMFAFPKGQLFFVDAVNTVLYYPEKPAMELRNVIKLSGNWILERSSLRDRVAMLEKKNMAMYVALEKSKTVPKDVKGGFVYSQVTLRYPEEWWQQLRIDKGANDGIKEGSAVMSEGYLIGRIVKVGSNYSWVELITSSSFLIAAAVDETRDLGVVNGDDKGNLKLLYIPESRHLKRGMKLSTSLMSELIPPGIPIGTILSVGESREGFIQMNLQAGAHLTQLYSVEVFVAYKVDVK